MFGYLILGYQLESIFLEWNLVCKQTNPSELRLLPPPFSVYHRLTMFALTVQWAPIDCASNVLISPI